MTEGPVEPTQLSTMDLDVVRRFLRNREADAERLGRLESATQRLSEETASLTTALNTYATQGQIQDIENVLSDHESRFEQRSKSLIALRLRIRRRTNVMFAITLVLLALTTFVLVHYIHSLNAERHRLCVQRNHDAVVRSQQTRAYFGPKLAQEQSNPNADPVLVSILQTLANDKPQTINCG